MTTKRDEAPVFQWDYSYRIWCEELRHDDHCPCRVVWDNVMATDRAIALEMARRDAKENGGELFNLQQPLWYSCSRGEWKP